MVLVFKYRDGKGVKKEVVGRPNNESEAFEIVERITKEKGYPEKYMRMISRDRGGYRVTTFDFGSHTDFFYLTDDEYEKELMKK